MTSTDGNDDKRRIWAIWIAATLTFGLLAANIIAHVAPGELPPIGEAVPLSQLHNRYLYDLQCNSILAAPIALGAWWLLLLFRRRPHWRTVLGLALTSVVVVFGFLANYTVAFISPYFWILSDLSFQGSHYYLGKFASFDNATVYYLGKCDSAGQTCVWQEVYEVFMTPVEPGPLMVDNSGNWIVVTMNGDAVYTFDGKHGVCGHPQFGRCIEGGK